MHAAPATHGAHTPPLHTLPAPLPQGAPSGSGARATHCSTPVEQSVRPWTHSPCDGVHDWFGTQVVHAPPWQTAFVPQAAPSGRVAASAWHVPVAHKSDPIEQGAEGGTHSAPSWHVEQPPCAEQTAPPPHACPASWLPMRTQTATPVEQSVA
jgi:hypothetical protein